MKNLKTIIITLILVTTVKGVNANSFIKSDKNKKAELSIEKVIKEFDMEDVKEADLNIEAWMISPVNWNTNKNAETVETEMEEKIQLEDWMFNFEPKEETLQLEDWMFKF